jgi:hypothetical protein
MKKLIAAVAIGGIAVVGWQVRGKHEQKQAQGQEVDAQDGKSLIVDRFWLDHMPSSERDPINFMAMFSDHKIGIMRNMTAFKGSDEMFIWGGGNGWRWPQNGDVDKPSIRVRTCHEDGMDYCMDVSGVSRGVKHYGSRKDWVVRSIADEQALAAKLDAAR